MKLEHDAVEALGWPERYQQGRLDERELEAFEEHYLHCPRCVDMLETDTALRAALRLAAARDALASTRPLAPIAWLSERSRGVQHGVLAAVLVAALAGHVWQWQHGQQLASALREARTLASLRVQAAAGGAQPSELAPSRPAATSVPEPAEGNTDAASRTAGPASGGVRPSAAAEPVTRTRVPLFVLARLRGEPGAGAPELVVRLTVRDAGAFLVLPEGLACVPRCAAHVVPRQPGRAVLGPYDVLVGADERGRVFVPADLLPPGIYDVRVGSPQSEADAESFVFRVRPGMT